MSSGTQSPPIVAGPFLGYNPSASFVEMLSPSDFSVQFASGDQPYAANYFVAYGAQTGFPPTLLASGSDANISAQIVSKGTGGINFGNGSGQLAVILDPGGLITVWPALIPGTGTGSSTKVVFTSVANPSYVNIAAAIAGVGTFGVELGLNNTANNTATIAGGNGSVASGYASIALGSGNIAEGPGSFVTGTYASDNFVAGSRCHMSVKLGTINGTSQIRELVLAGQTTGTTPVVLTSNGGALSTTNSIQLINNAVTRCRISVCAIDTTNGANRAYWDITAGIYRGASASTTVLDWSNGSGSPANYAGSGSGWTAVISVSTINGCGLLTFTGTGTDVYRIVARVDNVEVASG